MVRELADYAGCLDRVLATAEKLASTLCLDDDGPQNSPGVTSPARPARCLLLSNSEGAVVGFAAYFYTYSTWIACPGVYLEDLFVRADERGKGYSRKLLAEMARRVIEVQGGRLEWCVICTITPSGLPVHNAEN